MSDLTERLRALSRAEHDDLSVGDAAAEEIERLQKELEPLKAEFNKSGEAAYSAYMEARKDTAQRCAMIAHYEGSEICDDCNDILDTILLEFGLED